MAVKHYRKRINSLRTVCISLGHVDVPLCEAFFADMNLFVKAEAPIPHGLDQQPLAVV